jgi:hypothetical protein
VSVIRDVLATPLGDVADPDPEPPTIARPTGAERFAAMSPDEQDAAVGKEAAERIRKGELTLDELVARDTIHGERVITQKPLEEV